MRQRFFGFVLRVCRIVRFQDGAVRVPEAAAQFPAQDESQKGMVIDVVQTGYLLNGKVLRYAKVVVGA